MVNQEDLTQFTSAFAGQFTTAAKTVIKYDGDEDTYMGMAIGLHKVSDKEISELENHLGRGWLIVESGVGHTTVAGRKVPMVRVLAKRK